MRPSIVRTCLLALALLTLPGTALFAQGGATIVHAPEATKLLPGAVFFRGQSASIQGRNSGGVKYSDGMFTLATLVDNSGYSSSIAQKYQAYLITEVAIDIEGNTLPPGAYGMGFIADNKFVVQDVGAHDLFTASSTRDADLKPAVPLQVKADASEGKYRLYAGRSYITFSRK